MALLDFMKQGTQWLTDNTGMDWNTVQRDPGLAAKRLMGAPVDLNSQYQAQPTQTNLLDVAKPAGTTWNENTGWTTPQTTQMNDGIMTPLQGEQVYPNMGQVNEETSLPPSLVIGGHDRNKREAQVLNFANRDQSNKYDNSSSVMNTGNYQFPRTGTNTFDNTDPVTLQREAEAKAKQNPKLIAPSLLGENFGYESAPTGSNEVARAGNISVGNENTAVGSTIEEQAKIKGPWDYLKSIVPSNNSAVDNNVYNGDLSKMNQILSLEGVSDENKIKLLKEYGLPIPDTLGK